MRSSSERNFSLSLSLTHTYSHSHTLSLSHTHILSLTLFLLLPFSLSPPEQVKQQRQQENFAKAAAKDELAAAAGLDPTKFVQVSPGTPNQHTSMRALYGLAC